MRRSPTDGLDDEMRDHVERAAQELIDRGTAPDRARREARRAFGSLAIAAENVRAVWMPSWIDQALQDARYTARILVRAPLFTVASVLSLAIGIGAATTVFTVADSLLLQAPPGVRDPARVVEIARSTGNSGFGTMSTPAFRYLREHTTTLESMAATTMDPVPLSLTTGASVERVFGRTVSANFFATLGVRPALGRFFAAGEDRAAGGAAVVVLSDRFWRDRLQADAGVVGRTLRLNRVSFTVIGVAEAGFEHTTFVGTDVWMPLTMAAAVRADAPPDLLDDPLQTWHMAVGRLAPGATVASAGAELNALFASFRADHAGVPPTHGIVVARTGRVPVPVRTVFAGFIALLFVLAAMLLAIACSNVGGMLLARASVRHREIATRLAIGAGRLRLLRQLLLETAALFVLAGTVAVPATIWLVAVVQSLLPALPIPLQPELHVSGRTVLLTGGVALLASVVFGLAPARHALETNAAAALQGHGATPPRRRMRLRRGLVIAQVALAMAAVATGGLFVRTLRAASRVPIGFNTDNVLIASLGTPASFGGTGRGGTTATVAAMDAVIARVQAMPGVEAVGLGRVIPLQGGRFSLGQVTLPGLTAADAAALDVGGWDVVSPGYFTAVGLPLVAGRAFTPDDRSDRPPVAIVNEAFARAAWPDATAVGQQFRYAPGRDDEPRAVRVVGVVGNARNRTIGEAARPFVYVPFAQHPQGSAELFVRHRAGLTLARDLRQTLAATAPDLPLAALQAFSDAAALGLMPQRLAAGVAAAAGVVGLFLAAVGLYGVTGFVALQRTREMAIRSAFGATGTQVRRLIVGEAARLAAVGVAAGAVAAVLLGYVAEQQGLLIGATAVDPMTLFVVAIVMVAIVVVAASGPARRAASVLPADALRAE